MPKQAGNLKANRPMTMAELTADLAEKVQKKDPRYDFFFNYPFPPAAIPFFQSHKKTKALAGSNRSRKTTYGLIESIMIYTGIIPKELQGVYAHERELLDISPGGAHHRPRLVRIVVMDFTKHWPTVIKRMLLGNPEKNEVGLLPAAWANWSEKEHLFEGPDGSILDIFAADPSQISVDTRNLRGAAVDHTHIDEINAESVYTESLVRGAAATNGPRTVTATYCPQEGYDCWHYELFYKAMYDAISKRKLPPEKQNPSIYYQQISMRDNPSISEEAIQDLINSMRPWEVAYRVYGEYSYRGENPYFQTETLVEWEAQTTPGETYLVTEAEVEVDEGIFKGELLKIDPTKTMKGAECDEDLFPVWRVWAKPEDGRKYILSADISAGHAESDYQAASVWDATDRDDFHQVAQLRIKMMKPGDFGQQCACMANIYGNCLLVPESNGAGEAFIDRVRFYDELYTRVRDTNKRKEKETTSFGFSTDVSTKGPMLETLYKHIEKAHRNKKPFLRSQITVMELEGYEERIKRNQKNEAIREWGARSGSHDDTVMEAAIACRVIRTEHSKLSTCKLIEEEVVSYPDNHKLQKNTQQNRAFGKMRPQQSYFERQKQFRARYPHA